MLFLYTHPHTVTNASIGTELLIRVDPPHFRFVEEAAIPWPLRRLPCLLLLEPIHHARHSVEEQKKQAPVFMHLCFLPSFEIHATAVNVTISQRTLMTNWTSGGKAGYRVWLWSVTDCLISVPWVPIATARVKCISGLVSVSLQSVPVV